MKTARHFLSIFILLFLFTTSPVFSQDVFEDAFEINPSQELDKDSTEGLISNASSKTSCEKTGEVVNKNSRINMDKK